jgi:ubiquinol-cytochrome c reductase cytochrome b subunit
MSFWAATVITNLASAIPIAGKTVVFWLWGGYSVDNATLTRFYSLHYLLPFVLLGLVLIHILLLHDHKSSIPIGFSPSILYFDKIFLHPYFTIKDFLGFCLYGIVLMFFVCFIPNVLGHPDNYIPANPLVTPTHIVPEWYFLLFYAILRTVPSKLGGVVLLILAILILILIPFIFNKIGYKWFRHVFIYIMCFWIFLINCILLAWTGGNPAAFPFIELAFLCVIFYFGFFFAVYPFFPFLFFCNFYTINLKYGVFKKI